ncbi:unnamed protein product [Lactuca virosa]|uniref:Glutaredoxin domain-containing protein n=1 Tax=Lactuca virosa TaxID=75947 RepID=A0AAU9MAS5_9ASTR|nr:unnamed protein product [Lactuca virosa]
MTSAYTYKSRTKVVICLIAARRHVRIGNILCRLPRGYGVNTLSKSRPHTPAISGGLKNKQELGLKMGTIWSGGHKSREEIEMALSKVKEVVSSNPVVVFSKTYCGYCKRVKQLFKELNVSYKLLELDEESDGSEIQSALAEWTKQTTVPNVFIGGQHIGGSDAVMEKHRAGKLVPMLTEAGAIANNSAQLSSI